MSKRPAFQFYPDDWLTDVGLRECSPAARGVWIDLIALMHQGEPYGHLRKGRLDYSLGMIARTCGLETREMLEIISELEHHGVFSRTESGTIFSRKMVRDEELREARGAGGRKSANNPNVPKKKGLELVAKKDTLPAEVKDTFETNGKDTLKDILTRESSPTDTDTDTDLLDFDQEKGFAEFCEGLPDLTGVGMASSAYSHKISNAESPFGEHGRIMLSKDRWMRSKRWHDGYAKPVGKFFAEEMDLDYPVECGCGSVKHNSRDGPGKKQTDPSKLDQALKSLAEKYPDQ